MPDVIEKRQRDRASTRQRTECSGNDRLKLTSRSAPKWSFLWAGKSNSFTFAAIRAGDPTEEKGFIAFRRCSVLVGPPGFEPDAVGIRWSRAVLSSRSFNE